MAVSRVHLLANPGPAPVPDLAPVQEQRREFLFIGRIVSNKGCDVAIRAMAQLPTDCRLAVLGDGPAKESLESLGRELGLADRIEFAGWQPSTAVADRLSRCTALVVPSVWPEPFGLVALEAFARARPVIASRIGGLQDIVRDGISGRLVDVDSPAALAQAMRSLLESPRTAAEMGLAGKADLESRFMLDHHLDGLEAIYNIATESV